MSEEITRHRKRPVVVEAIQWTGGNAGAVRELTGRENFDYLDGQDRANCDDPDATATVFDKLHSTWVLVFDGQWIIKGVKGEFYPCADDVFRETYEPAGDAHVSGKTLGQIGYEALQRALHADAPTAWTHPAVAAARPAWETAMRVVVARAAGATAEDGGAAEITRLRADLADAEAEIARWPRCPAGCRCRVGTNDADALECDCDGPCTLAAAPAAPQPAPELAAAMGETRAVRQQLAVIRDLCEKRLRIVGMVDGKGVARKIIALIDKLEAK